MDINGGNTDKRSLEIILLLELTSNALSLQVAQSKRR